MDSFASDCEQPGHAGGNIKRERDSEAGILPGISIDAPGSTDNRRTPILQHLSTPVYQSPLRHYRRSPSQHREVKETLDARSEYTSNDEDGKAEHHINQYIIKDEIGRGSFGAVHLAVDQYGKEYAVKEFSKSRLRKRAQSNILRRPHGNRSPGNLAAGSGFNTSIHRHLTPDNHCDEEQKNSLYLIKEEIAIMKKLDHPNLVSLIEVLDDPEEDSLYMVLEMCKKGVVMKVGLNQKADPYDAENCRCWFRDLILGIEYLHAQGVVHRDIKPDNLLLTEDNVLKIVDFGVSEMFEKKSEMMTAKSAGSPAFLPPELCVTKHGDISGKAADVWSMGVSLYCLRFGCLPFERPGILELYEAIKDDQVQIELDSEPGFEDIMRRLLEKDPKKRITMAELREHPWVTKNGKDPLLSAEENTADLVESPSAIEVNHAITTKMRNLIVLVKAVKNFKSLIDKKRPTTLSGTLERSVRALDQSLDKDIAAEALYKLRSVGMNDQRNAETTLPDDVHHDINTPNSEGLWPRTNKMDSSVTMIDPQSRQNSQNTLHHKGQKDNSEEVSERPELHSESPGEKGHAHDPLDEAPLFLGIGNGGDNSLDMPPRDAVAESPTAADFNIYDAAYQEEVGRIRAAEGHRATVYLNRRVEGWKSLLDRAREKGDEHLAKDKVAGTGYTFPEIAAKAMENTKTMGKDLCDKGELAFESVVRMAMEKRNEMVEKEGE